MLLLETSKYLAKSAPLIIIAKDISLSFLIYELGKQ